MSGKRNKKRRPVRDITGEINKIADGYVPPAPKPVSKSPLRKRGRPRGGRKSLQIKEYIQLHPHASNEEVSLAINCHQRTVSKARTDLRRMGLIDPLYNDRVNTKTAPLDVEGAAALATQIERAAVSPGAELTIEDLRKMVAQVALTARREGNHTLLASVSALLLKIDDKLGGKTELGPPPPLTEDAKVTRLGVLLDVCGPSITARAATSTFSPEALKAFLDEVGTFLSKIPTSTGEMPLATPEQVENLPNPEGVGGETSEGP